MKVEEDVENAFGDAEDAFGPMEDAFGVAVVGMAGRFPGARSVDELWRNLRDGVESISFFDDAELRAAGVTAQEWQDPAYIRARGVVADAEMFDAALFGFSPREARLMDPQQRLLLECAWEALENAACDPQRFAGTIGVYAGASQSSYAFANLLSNPELLRSVSSLELHLGNDKDFLAALVSYRLNLQGPSITVSTACSTSLVAVHLACQALLNHECDLALAAGVSIKVPQTMGYRWERGGIASADGHCRSFDAGATGSVAGSGAGVVVLRRLGDALTSRDPIRAVILGSAVNNDGAQKVGFTAPSVEGQAAVIAEAQSVAGVAADSIGLIEGHGSGTAIGDPIELRALGRVFGRREAGAGPCALGSIKSNVGHLDAAAGVTGLIKAVLALENRTLPPSLHFTRPNPEAPLAGTPFFVPTVATPWATNGGDGGEGGDGGNGGDGGAPRRAGVNSFGMGGTNAHVIVEEAPALATLRDAVHANPWQLLVLSAASAPALETVTDRLAAHLESHPRQPIADVAYTGQVGRRALRHRRVLVCQEPAEAAAALAGRDPRRVASSADSVSGRPVAFLLSGVGDHYPGMARGLYDHEPAFRAAVDTCADLLEPLAGLDIRQALFPPEEAPAASGPAVGSDLRRMVSRNGAGTRTLDRTAVLQPALFVLDYALAQLWAAWGVRPQAMMGYSLGEYVAACLAGVFSLADALRLVTERARLLDGLPGGAMLAVPLGEASLQSLLGDDLSLAAVNGPETCVVAGSLAAIDGLARRLAARAVPSHRLPTAHAFHSRRMEPAGAELARLVASLAPRPPRIPYVTNVTGTWITAAEAVDPEHWVRHLCGTVRFADGLRTLWSAPPPLLLEVGPGHGLATLANQQAGGAADRLALASLPPVYEGRTDRAWICDTVGRLWLAGVEIDWDGYHGSAPRRRVEIPTYPFERQRHWVDAVPAAGVDAAPELASRDATVATVATAAPAAMPAPPVTPATPATPGAGTAPAASVASVHPRPDLRTAYVAPRSVTEEAIAALWQDFLQVAPVGAFDSFFELGGQSLLAAQLLLKLRRSFGVEVPIERLLAAPTVADLAAALERAGETTGASGGDAAASPAPDLWAAAVLDPDIRPGRAMVRERLADPDEVLLTGATGFLGAFLLREILARTQARVRCLVRAGSVEEGATRIRACLEGYGIALPPEQTARIVPLLGDLGSPAWRLEPRTFAALAEQLDAIYHCGAWVNFTYPYRLLEPANVLGTREALRLAAAGRAKPLHLISTLAVLRAATPDSAGVVSEDSDLVAPERLTGGYPQSKWVAERLVAAGRERGIPVTVHRPGSISGDSRTGSANTRDLVWSFLKACLQMGLAPDLDLPFDPIPVDWLAGSIVHLSQQEASLGRAFHYLNPRPIVWREVFLLAREMGYAVRFLPLLEWERELAGTLRETSGNALAPFASLLRPAAAGPGAPSSEASVPPAPTAPAPPPPPTALQEPRFDRRNTEQGLANSGLLCPPADRRLFSTYLAHFIASGFLPAPGPATVAAALPQPALAPLPG